MSVWPILTIGGVLFAAYANGANDNFKGVATLLGSGIADYRKALWWATAATLSGSVLAMVFAIRLIPVCQGKGLVPDELVQSPDFLVSVILGAAITVIAATRIGMPVSTTHVSCGSLFGIGAVNGRAQWGVIRNSFLAWVLTLPFAAVSAGAIHFLLFRWTTR